MTDKPRVLVLGATGLFGELLARRIAGEKRFSLVAAGRGLSSLRHLREQIGCDIAVLDRNDTQKVSQTLVTYKPFAVVDCAGPFQYYGADPFQFARQVLKAGSHYIDIADASAFVVGIGALDDLAQANGLTAIAGASSTPAISGAVAEVLTESMQRVVSIETAIVPGNRARRTLSVMKAILGQIGKPFEITRHGKRVRVYGWGETRSVDLKLPVENPVKNRLASLVQTPDVELFPRRFAAETVTLRAGLEINTFHRLLQCAGLLVRSRFIPSLAPCAAFARWVASGFESIGSEIGGMQVTVIGKTESAGYIQRSWDLVADDGRGPEIPTLPVSVLLDKLYEGSVAPGARPSPGEITLEDLESRFTEIEAQTVIYEASLQPLFKTALGKKFSLLPKAVRALHNTPGQTIYAGTAQSMGPSGLSGRLVAWLVRFPKAGEDVSVRVTITADQNGEAWKREFNGVAFNSYLSVDGNGDVWERFGVMTARIGLTLRDNKLHFPVLSAKLFGVVPLPRFLLPESIAHEAVDEQGRFVFDVLIKTPFGARIAHYRGWLVRQIESDIV